MTLTQQLKNKAHLAKKVYEYYRYIRPFTKKNRSLDNLNSNTNISVFSEPRGGSTWVGEILCKIPNSILVFEPMFLMPAYREIKKVNFCFNQYIPENADWPEAEEYFRQLYNREIGSLSAFRIYYHNDNLANIASAKYFIYKDVNSNMLLPWLTKRFNINPIYILRHPCAVIASQLKYKHWDYILKDVKAYFPDPQNRYKEIYTQYQDIIDTITKPEERLAAEWALHNIIPVSHEENDRRWITVSYEKLYKDPEPSLTRIFNRLNIEIPGEILTEITRPSITTIDESRTNIKAGNQLESWKRSLSSTQVKNILRIVNEFGIDFYDESPEPDYSKIYRR
jgi:hypothetical protein